MLYIFRCENMEEFYIFFSACYAGKNLWKEAMEEAQICLNKDEKFVKGYFRLATAQTELKLFDDAISSLEKGLLIDPGKYYINIFTLKKNMEYIFLIIGNELFMKQIRLIRAKASSSSSSSLNIIKKLPAKQKELSDKTKQEVII